MIPILYAKNATDFDNNGIGHLRDTVSCKVTEERNGDYTLTLQYPIKGAWYDQITEGAIIKAKANETSALQLFRIYKSSKPLKGMVTFHAEHISYDLRGLPLRSLSITDTTAEAALNGGFSAALLPHRFTAWSDIETLNSIDIKEPRSLRNLCGGKEGSALDVWGGEFEFDNFLVKLHKNRGANRGVVINYGKNLTDAKQERNISECYTHFFPYAVKKNGETEETVTLPEGVIELINPENIGHTRALPLDISNEFSNGEEINEENLRTHANEYIEVHKLGVPAVNITLSFMQTWDSPEYAKAANFERVTLCDTVTVRFLELGIDTQAKVIKTEYDSLAERFSKIEAGDARSSLADTVTGVKESIDQTNKDLTESKHAASAELQKAITDATDKITGNSGGYVVHYPPNNPQEILVMDTPHIETATRIWRWNSSGLGHSSNGYNGPYGTAMTMDGRIVADFITTGTLKAINISGCTITGGTLNINDNFIVDKDGGVQLNGGITWGTGSSPTQVLYAESAIAKPTDNSSWSTFPATSSDSWHKTYSSSADYYASYTYDGGKTWTEPIKIRGTDGINGINGKDGVDGSDATVTSQNVFTALTNGGEMYGCFTALNGKLYINADYIRAGTMSSDLIFTGKISSDGVDSNAIIDGGYLAVERSDRAYRTDLDYWGLRFWSGPSYITELGSLGASTDGGGLIANGTWHGNGSWTLDNYISKYQNIQLEQVGYSSSFTDGGVTFKAYTFGTDGSYNNIPVAKMSYRSDYGAFAMETDPNGQANSAMLFNASNSKNNIFMGSWEFANGEPSYGSDRNIKTDIEDITENYSTYFDNLRVKTFKYIKGNAGRKHVGLIAQDAFDALGLAELSSQDFAGVCVRNEGTDQELWTIRIGEFVALCIYEIQKLKKEVANIKAQNEV